MVIMFEDFPRYIFSRRKHTGLNLEFIYWTKFLNTLSRLCKFKFEIYIPKYSTHKAHIVKCTWIRPFNHISGCHKRNI